MSDGMEADALVEVGFPFRLSRYGRVADPDYALHVEQMIELVLFTSPGERVNRPDFGCGLLELVFQPDDTSVAATTQYLVQGSLQRWLGDVISVRQVVVTPREPEIEVRVAYLLRADRSERVAVYHTGEAR